MPLLSRTLPPLLLPPFQLSPACFSPPHLELPLSLLLAPPLCPASFHSLSSSADSPTSCSHPSSSSPLFLALSPAPTCLIILQIQPKYHFLQEALPDPAYVPVSHSLLERVFCLESPYLWSTRASPAITQHLFPSRMYITLCVFPVALSWVPGIQWVPNIWFWYDCFSLCFVLAAKCPSQDLAPRSPQLLPDWPRFSPAETWDPHSSQTRDRHRRKPMS